MWKRGYFLSVILCVLGALCTTWEPVSALELSTEVYRVNDTGGGADCSWHYQPSNSWSGYTGSASSAIIGTNATNQEIDGIRCRQGNGNNIVVSDGDYLEVYLKTTDTRPSTSTVFWDGWGGQIGNLIYWNNEARVLSLEKIGETTQEYSRYEYWRFIFRSEGGTNPDLGIRFRTSSNFLDLYDVRILTIGVYRPKVDGDYASVLSAINSNVSSMNDKLTVQNGLLTQIRDGIGQTTDAINNLNISIEQSTQEGYEAALENEKEQIQDTSDEAQDTADDAQNTIDSDTASLTDQIGTIIGIIKDTPATNCNINGNMGKVNLGTMNMCQGVPQSVRDIIVYVASGVLVLAILRLAYSLVKVYLGYLQSYTGGNE